MKQLITTTSISTIRPVFAQGASENIKRFHQLKKLFEEGSLEKLEDLSAEFVDAEVMSESYEVFENILNASLTIDSKKKKSFNREILEVVKKYEKSTKTSNTNESKQKS